MVREKAALKSQWFNIVQVYFLLMIHVQCRLAGSPAHQNGSGIPAEGSSILTHASMQSTQGNKDVTNPPLAFKTFIQ